jgi:hypothetical protein
MKKIISDRKVSKKMVRLFYACFLPITTILSLLILSAAIPRKLFLSSSLLDFLARLWICLVFSMGYLIMSDIYKFRAWYYGGKLKITNGANDSTTMTWNIVMTLMLGVFAALASWWTIQTFLPILDRLAVYLALLNGVLYAMPLFGERKQFRF